MRLKFKILIENSLVRVLKKYKKYTPLLFFIGGFLWDSLTLGRIDRVYDIVLLSLYMVLLTLCLYFFNSRETKKKYNFIRKYNPYFPWAIQFFLGGLSSAFVIYFSRSVSLSKTVAFLAILVFLLFANEVFKKRISNKYLQFGAYSFVSFTFFAFIIPVLIKEMNTLIFTLSGVISLMITLFLLFFISRNNKSGGTESKNTKLLWVVFSVYIAFGFFYYFRLIPPVPLALSKGVVAYDIQKENGKYKVSYEVDEWYVFWRDHKIDFNYKQGEKVFIFTAVFAPTELKKQVYHQWKVYNDKTKNWELTDKISFNVVGGRAGGFRGYSYKNNVYDGDWKVEVVTEEDLVIGVVNFKINSTKQVNQKKVIEKLF